MKDIKKLRKYMKPYTLFAILGPLFMCVEVMMDLLQPTLMQKMIDVGIANQDNGYVLKLGLVMMICAIIGLIGGAGSSVFASKAAVNFAADVRQDVFKMTSRFSNQNTDSFTTGKLITILTGDIEPI